MEFDLDALVRGGKNQLDLAGVGLPASPGRKQTLGGKLNDRLRPKGTPKVKGFSDARRIQVEGRGHMKAPKGLRRGFWLQVLRRAHG